MGGFDLDAALAGLPDPRESMNFDYLDRARARIGADRQAPSEPVAEVPVGPVTPAPAGPGAPQDAPVVDGALEPATDALAVDEEGLTPDPEPDPDGFDDPDERDERDDDRDPGPEDRSRPYAHGGASSAAGAGTAVASDVMGGFTRPAAPPPPAGAEGPDSAEDPDQVPGRRTPGRDTAADQATDRSRPRPRHEPRDLPVPKSSTRARDLPRDPLSLTGPDRGDPPKVLNMPPEIIMTLRAEVSRQLVETYGLREAEAQSYAASAGQASLVIAFLAAYLDLPLEADRRTMLLMRLFRGRNPLLGAVLARLEALEEAERSTQRTLQHVRDDGAVTAARIEATEMSATWLVAERAGLEVASNLGRATDDELTERLVGRPATRMRDLVREAARTQHDRETKRQGRPIR